MAKHRVWPCLKHSHAVLQAGQAMGQSKAGTEGVRKQCRVSVGGELVGCSGRSTVPERGALGCPQEEGRDCQRVLTGFADTYGVQVQVRDNPGH